MKPGNVYLLRHGQTYWAMSGQHTGRTDVPLTEVGKQQAVAAGERVREAHPEAFAAVWCSPLVRASETAKLAGFDAKPCDDLMEWDYGRAEGRTRGQIGEALGRAWNLWLDGPQAVPEALGAERVETLPDGQQVQVHLTEGETLDEAFARARRVVEKVRAYSEEGKDVLLVAHSHILRLVAMAWVDLPPVEGRKFELGTARYIVLGDHKGQPVIEHWGA
ncbi:histidine phosphatase family protein [Bifidobacterium sp. SMB2]|uniref:Histidine phosphatase family protein n=1 Tax=Bifidobacterium saimiriisciurei TaxID=2661627 RepID=A0ABX0CI19_9BIFI|nr:MULTISPECIES: histidine phosphatase family protein [Bifidobacterium]NEG95629.1 histidine phosphatase family protein [Bifidobacterium sp. SMB2]NEH11942.1 histidine phosphatase family protein [Bifidobacterium saimiriisciurei]